MSIVTESLALGAAYDWGLDPPSRGLEPSPPISPSLTSLYESGWDVWDRVGGGREVSNL